VFGKIESYVHDELSSF